MIKKIEVKIKKKVGKIVSDKMDKTRVVEISEKRSHPIYQKTFMVSKKIKAHDENNAYHTGDEVEIAQTKPYSKTKAWVIVGKRSGVENA